MSMYDFIEHETREARKRGLEEGRQEGLAEGGSKALKDLIFSTLSEYGQTPAFLEQRIQTETDHDILNTWAKEAIRSGSVQDFLTRTGLRESMTDTPE